MLIDALTDVLSDSGCLDTFWGKLDEGEDAFEACCCNVY